MKNIAGAVWFGLMFAVPSETGRRQKNRAAGILQGFQKDGEE
jgi:hypothetical protein